LPYLIQQFAAGGPLIDVLVGVSQPRRQAMQSAGLPIPQQIQMRALIDTGASGTCVDPCIIKSLGLTPSGSVPIHTPSTNGVALVYSQYDISLALHHAKGTYHFHSLPVIEASLTSQGIQALIGRDVLEECLFIYDGASGSYTLAF
jgi:predicted aspartyl protease